MALPPLGAFDLVTAIYLLNYATSKDQLLGMCQSAYDNLVAGGRFVAYTVNPAYTLSKPNGAKYGNYFLRQTPEEDRYVCDGEFVTEPPTPFQCYQWSQEAHERAIQEAGFRTFAWHPSEVSPEDVARYGEAYWQDFRRMPGHRAGLPEVTWVMLPMVIQEDGQKRGLTHRAMLRWLTHACRRGCQPRLHAQREAIFSARGLEQPHRTQQGGIAHGTDRGGVLWRAGTWGDRGLCQGGRGSWL